jgi:hypothetical protein
LQAGKIASDRFGGALLTVIDLPELSGRGASCRALQCLPARPRG